MRTLLTIAGVIALSGCVIVSTGGDTDAVSYASHSSTGVQGNDQVVHELRAVGKLGGLEVSGPIQVEVLVGESASLDIETDSNLLPLVHSDTSGDTLKLWVDGGVRSRNGIRVTYRVPQLHTLKSVGSSRIVVNGLAGGKLAVTNSGSAPIQLAGRVSYLDVNQFGSGSVNAAALSSDTANASLSGSGRLTLGQVRGDTLSAELRGSGAISANGSVRKLTVQLSGSGNVQFDSLDSDAADLSSNGSGSIAAAVGQKLVAQSKGSGRITVRGNPSQRNISGKNVSVVE